MRKNRNHQDNVRRYVTAFAVFIIFMAISLAVFFSRVQRNIKENVSESISDDVGRQGYHFRSIIDEQYGYLRGVATHIGKSDELVSEDHMELLKSISEQSGMERLAIIEKDGTAHYDSGEVKNVSGRGYFKRGMQGQSWFSDPMNSLIDGRPRIVLSVPIYRDKKIVGVAAGSYNVGALTHILFEDIYDGAGCSILLTGGGNVVAYDGNKDYMKMSLGSNFFEDNQVMQFLEGGSLARVRADFNLQRPGRYRINYEGNESYLGYSPLGLNGWMLCYIVPKGKAEESYRFIREYEIVLIEVLVIGVLCLFLAMYRINAHRQQELLHSAQRDALTGTYNKKSTEEKVNEWLSDDELCSGCQALMMLDIDKFKEINDIYGHVIGDMTLEKVGGVLQKQFREGDIIGRIGGDEFVVLMKNISEPKDAGAKAEEICKCFRSIVLESEPSLHLTCSIGLSYSPEHGKTYLELYQCADKALYRTKQKGRDGYTCYSCYQKELQNDQGETKCV